MVNISEPIQASRQKGCKISLDSLIVFLLILIDSLTTFDKSGCDISYKQEYDFVNCKLVSITNLKKVTGQS